jgi:hypothetical protein
MSGSSIYYDESNNDYDDGKGVEENNDYEDIEDIKDIEDIDESTKMAILEAIAEENHLYYNFNEDGFIDYDDIDERHHTHYNSDDTDDNDDSDDDNDDGVEETKGSNYKDSGDGDEDSDDGDEDSVDGDNGDDYYSDEYLFRIPASPIRDYDPFTNMIIYREFDRYIEKIYSRDKITSIPEYFPSLDNLRDTYLYPSTLTSLPETIPSLSNLRDTYLCSSTLTSLPETISSLSDFSYLNLCPNTLTSLPETIPSLSNLRLLFCSDTNYDKAQLTYQMFGNENNLSNSKTHLNKTSILKPKYKKTCFSTYSSVRSIKKNHR